MMPLAQLDGSHRCEADGAGAEVVADLHVTVHWHRHTRINWPHFPESILTFFILLHPPTQIVLIRVSQKDVVYLIWPITPAHMSPKAEGGGGCCEVSVNEYSCAHEAQINFGDLTLYLIYGFDAWFTPIACARGGTFKNGRQYCHELSTV